MAKVIIATITAFDKNDNVTNDIVVECFSKQALTDIVLCQRNNRKTSTVFVEVWGLKMFEPMIQTVVQFSEPKTKYIPSPDFRQNHRIAMKL